MDEKPIDKDIILKELEQFSFRSISFSFLLYKYYIIIFLKNQIIYPISISLYSLADRLNEFGVSSAPCGLYYILSIQEITTPQS